MVRTADSTVLIELLGDEFRPDLAPNASGGNSSGDVYDGHLYSRSSCNPNRSCFNPEAKRELRSGEERRLVGCAELREAARLELGEHARARLGMRQLRDHLFAQQPQPWQR